MKLLVVSNQLLKKSTNFGNQSALQQVNGLRRLGVKVEIYQINSIKKGFKSYCKSILPLYKLWKSGSFDLMHVQFGGLISLIGVVLGGKKTIISFHGSDLHGGRIIGFQSFIMSKLNTISSKIASFFSGGIIVVSENLLRYLPKSVVRNKPIRVIFPGVDYSHFKILSKEKCKKILQLDLKKKYILFSDISGSPVKRRDLAEEIISELQIDHPDVDLLLLNQKPYKLVPIYLNASDCLLVTSDKEGSPNIVKEALAVNLPIVSFDVGDVKEQCSEVDNCQIVHHDIKKMIHAINKCIMIGRKGGAREQKKNIISNKVIAIKLFNFILDLHYKSG